MNRIELVEGRAGSPLYMLLGFVLAILGGLSGIYIGYVYSRSKIKYGGKELYTYDDSTRRFGEIIMWLGIFIFLSLVLNFCFNN